MRLPVRALVVLVLALALVPAGPQAQATGASMRVYAGTAIVTFDAMIADLAKADVVLVDGVPGDASSRRVELAMIEGLARLNQKVVLALAAIERDAQEPLEHFLMQHTTEPEFLAEARPAADYVRDVKPFVDFAIARSWHVVAASVPRQIAGAVRESGLGALAARPASDKGLFAHEVLCPSGGKSLDCVVEETIAESVAQAQVAGTIGGVRSLVVALVGAVPSARVAGRVTRRLPDRRAVVVRIVPTPSLTVVTHSAAPRAFGDYLIYVEAAPSAAHREGN